MINNTIEVNTTASTVVRLGGLILGYMCSYMGVIFVYYTVKKITEKLINAKKKNCGTNSRKGVLEFICSISRLYI